MRLLNEDNEEILEYDKNKGYLKEDKIVITHHGAVQEVKEVSHYETIAKYPNGGSDVKKIIDVAGIEPKEEYDEYENIQRYVLFTAEELAVKLEEAKASKKAEMDEIATKTIYNGVDVETTTGVEHFSLTEKDQINITNLGALIGSGKTLLYHSDGNLCRVFTDGEVTNLVSSAIEFTTYNTTLINHIHTWINSCDSIEEVNAVVYGTDGMPEETKKHFDEILNID